MGRILVAEDSVTDIEYVRNSLKDTGHEIVTAADGEEAEKKIRSERFDLIILDVIMPKKNGYQVCRDLKRDAELKDIPVIMITSKSQESDRFWGMKQGANEYIIKPYEPDELLSAVKKYI